MLKSEKISLDHIFEQVKGNIVSDMGGEKVMLSVKNEKYYNLGEIGGVIWGKIEKGISGNQLVSHLIAHYNVEQSDCEEQVLSFLNLLYKEKLINISE